MHTYHFKYLYDCDRGKTFTGRISVVAMNAEDAWLQVEELAKKQQENDYALKGVTNLRNFRRI
jgi:hypothetical protein